jgi:serine/threonine protein kinase
MQGKAYNGAASDIWSCGVILFALISGRLPFDDENIRALLGKVRMGKYVMPNEIRGNARDLVTRMLEIDPKKRITVCRLSFSRS